MFSLLPLLQVGMILMVRQHFMNLQFPDELQPYLIGGDFLGVSEGSMILQAALAAGFFVIAALTWRGRPAAMRLVMVLAVIALTVIQFLSTVLSASGEQNLETGISSGDSLLQSLSVGQLAMNLLVLLYVIWYLNRGPARAFFRGHYRTPPDNTADLERETARQT
jgi:hypothetical protein